jgi:hypothetical protein
MKQNQQHVIWVYGADMDPEFTRIVLDEMARNFPEHEVLENRYGPSFRILTTDEERRAEIREYYKHLCDHFQP